jgi:hypothetical protein
LANINKQAGHAHSYEERREDLEEQRSAIGPEVRRARVLRHVGKLKAEDLPDSIQLREVLETVSGRVLEDPNKLTAGRDFKTLLTLLGQFCTMLEQLVDRAWEDVRAEEASVDETFLSQVERVPGQGEIVRRLRREIQSLEGCASSVPETEEEWQDYIKIRKEVEKLVQGLAPENFPKAVRSFFQKVQVHPGAPWSSLTDEVRQWLEDKDLLDRLFVRLH